MVISNSLILQYGWIKTSGRSTKVTLQIAFNNLNFWHLSAICTNPNDSGVACTGYMASNIIDTSSIAVGSGDNATCLVRYLCIGF